MNIQWIPLLLGAFFGLVPARKFIRTPCRYVGYRRLRKVMINTPMSRRARHRNWQFPLGWIDLLRGYATAWMFGQALSVSAQASRSEHLAVMLFTSGLLLLALWRQSAFRGKPHATDQTVAPTGFLLGMMAALLPVMVTVAALIIGVAAAIAAGGFTFGYVLACVVTLATGQLFTGNLPQVGLWSLLVAFPLLINWVRRTELVMPVRFKALRPTEPHRLARL